MNIRDNIRYFVKKTFVGQFLLYVKMKMSGYKPITSIGGKMKQYKKMMNCAYPEKFDTYFLYHIDENLKIINTGPLLSNMPVDYSKVINAGLYELKATSSGDNRSNRIIRQNNDLIDMIIAYVKKNILSLDKLLSENADGCDNNNAGDFDAGNFDHKHYKKLKNNLESMLVGEAQNLSDACQRILIWNQFLWQSGHNLMGLGRLDKILEKAYLAGQKCKKCNEEAGNAEIAEVAEEVDAPEDAEEVVEQFLLTLHKYYKYKSAVLIGDTGQVIELGGEEQDGTYFSNDLTLLFIKKLRELHIPDPKIVLRVSDNTPQQVWEEAVKTICSGIGNPLLSNDNVIIPAMCEYYNSRETGFNYATTACWSPVALGNSIGQCNPIMLQMVKPFLDIFYYDESKNVPKNLKGANGLNELNALACLTDFDKFLKEYYRLFEKYVDDYIAPVDQIKWEKDPILTFFTQGCLESGRDISEGGAVYNHYGMQSIGFPNLVNSLMNIKEFVYDKHVLSLDDVKKILACDYKGYENLIALFNGQDNNDYSCNRFGHDNEYVIKFTNDLIDGISSIIKKKQNRFGEKYKFGISSSTYISDGKRTKATFDGRRDAMPLGVQISSDQSVAYTEIANFASKLNYSAVFSNGNVMDLMIDKTIFDTEKMLIFLTTCIKIGVFQIQINILSESELLDAMLHPEKHTNLIVRVWGFNAYFNDLPNEYKKLILERVRRSSRGF